jgi:signal peptidase I
MVIGIIFLIPFLNFPFLIAGRAALPYVRSNIVQAYAIPSGSMASTIQMGDRVLVDSAIYKKSKPQRGDLIVFRHPLNPQRVFLKRLIAFGGETVEIKEGHVYINGLLCLDPKIKDRDYMSSNRSVMVSDGTYYVLGDNGGSSEDSRYFGFVPRKNVLGKVYKIYWPLNRSGKVE